MYALSVTSTSRESTWAPLSPRAANAAATILLESISPKAATWSVVRGVISPTAEIPRSSSSSASKSVPSSEWNSVKRAVPSSSLAVL